MYEDLSSVPQNPLKKKKKKVGMVAHIVIPALQRQADSWGSLVSQICLFGESLATERPIIKIRQTYLKNSIKDCPLASALTRTHIHVHTLKDLSSVKMFMVTVLTESETQQVPSK